MHAGLHAAGQQGRASVASNCVRSDERLCVHGGGYAGPRSSGVRCAPQRAGLCNVPRVHDSTLDGPADVVCKYLSAHLLAHAFVGSSLSRGIDCCAALRCHVCTLVTLALQHCTEADHARQWSYSVESFSGGRAVAQFEIEAPQAGYQASASTNSMIRRQYPGPETSVDSHAVPPMHAMTHIVETKADDDSYRLKLFAGSPTCQ